MPDKNGHPNGYDRWATCQSCGHEHWTATIFTMFPICPEGIEIKCLSCVVDHPCVFELTRELVRA